MSFRIPSTNPDLHAGGGAAIESFDNAFGNETDAASGAIAIKEGTVAITKAGVAVMTLAVPTAGSIPSGGDDFKKLEILSTTAQAHTVTTPANGLNGNRLTATFAAAAGNSLKLVALGGVWYVVGSTGITLT